MICGLDTLMLVYWVGRVVSISKNIMKIECVRMLQMLKLVALSSRVVCIGRMLGRGVSFVPVFHFPFHRCTTFNTLPQLPPAVYESIYQAA